jgi:hypothetical protein
VRTRRIVLLLVLALGALVCCVGIREDELLCEEAAAHLASCCPGFDAGALGCTYSTGCGTTTYPALGIDQSKCINRENCGQLVSTSVCERAQTANPVSVSEDASAPGDEDFAQVCP